MEIEVKSAPIRDAESLEDFRALLRSVSLPCDDLSLDRHLLLGYYEGNRLIGTGALELCGPYALLRSLAVKDALRGRSLGSRITDELIDLARENNVERIYLLTETARLFFKRKGFVEVDRKEVPAEVQASSEFSGVCSESAICMTKTL
ncbi:MAG TPA: arsenic resistance N-acetyltransferase ArsN2 [Cyclobacteriaceae bacterium]|jgi:amino-acid N-acetyltransferase